MENGVVEAVEDGFRRLDLTTLKFNFRGVGRSSGSFSDGVGETEDVVAAFTFLQECIGKDQRIVLAGYSFGAWVASMAVTSRLLRPSGLVLVAFPFSIYSSEHLASFDDPIYLVGGSRDDISPIGDLLALYNGLQCEKHLKVVDSSHFYEGREQDISDFVFESFREKEGD